MRDLAEGDRVSAGTVLVRIRSAEYEDKVQPGGLAGRGRRGDRAEGEARLRSRDAPLRQPEHHQGRLRRRPGAVRRDAEPGEGGARAHERGRDRAAGHVGRGSLRRRDREEGGRARRVRGPGGARVRRGPDGPREDRDRRAGHGAARPSRSASPWTSASTRTATARSRRGSAAWRRRPTPGRGTSRSRSRSPTATTRLKAGMIGSLELAAAKGDEAAGLVPGSALGHRAGGRRAGYGVYVVAGRERRGDREAAAGRDRPGDRHRHHGRARASRTATR